MLVVLRLTAVKQKDGAPADCSIIGLSGGGFATGRWRMAVREGFEPSVELLRSYNGLANRRLRPLGHLTVNLSLREIRTWSIDILHATRRRGLDRPNVGFPPRNSQSSATTLGTLAEKHRGFGSCRWRAVCVVVGCASPRDAQGFADFRLLTRIADFARLSLKLSLSGIETPGSLAEVAGAHDIVSLEHASGLVSRHLHRDPLRDAGADEIADGGSAEVVQDATRTSSFHTGRSESDPEALDGPARTVEHTRADDLELPLVILGDCSCCSSTSRNSRVIGNVRPSPFLVFPGLSLTSPAPKSTWRHSSGRTSLSIRHPVRYGHVDAVDRRRAQGRLDEVQHDRTHRRASMVAVLLSWATAQNGQPIRKL